MVVRKVEFHDKFVEGMTAIFNETPVRQERKFLHYGKTFETVKRQFSRFLFREEILGVFLGDALFGFAILADAGRFAALTQIISCVKHRDKSPNNALMAKAVEVCAERKVSQLVYALWPRGPLRDFKRHNGFEPVNLPGLSWVPLTIKGALALKLATFTVAWPITCRNLRLSSSKTSVRSSTHSATVSGSPNARFGCRLARAAGVIEDRRCFRIRVRFHRSTVRSRAEWRYLFSHSSGGSTRTG